MSRTIRIRDRLTEIFEPTHLSVVDDSARHAGHAGAAPEGETHYNVEIEAEAFAPLNRVARQRAVMDALSAEFEAGLHALSIKARPPAS